MNTSFSNNSFYKNSRVSFAELLQKHIPAEATGTSLHQDLNDVEPFAGMNYPAELAAKNTAIAEFWKQHRLHGTPEPMVPSPFARHYRTTSKRRVFFAHNRFRLRFSHRSESAKNPATLPSLLEPKEHEAIYSFLIEKLNTPGFTVAARQLTYIIIRGSYTEFSVIFNVAGLSGPIIKNLKSLAQHLQNPDSKVVSSFVFCDPTRSDYYLDMKAVDEAWKIKKLFGSDFLHVSIGDLKFRYNPVSFSQINLSILPKMLERVQSLCRPNAQERFIDLYCGYGLFANAIGRHYRNCWGIDVNEESVDHARDTAKYLAKKNNLPMHAHLRTAPITPESLDKLLPVAGQMPETIVLDPPRQGPAEGVIQFCAHRQASRIVHIFCNVDRIPDDAALWQRNGYRITDCIPLDMFPGTAGLEVILLLKPFR
jgi:tRNA/tmRNA/rRNA uracil-C5-methylase (TrmA/RlmC/RlmD family)